MGKGSDRIVMAYHCDLDSCDSWQRADTDLPGGFLTVTTAFGDLLGHFCTLDHLMGWAAAHSAPTEEIAA